MYFTGDEFENRILIACDGGKNNMVPITSICGNN